MDRLIAPNTVAVGSGDTAPVTGTPGQATSGNPATNTPATQFPAYAFNAIQEELIAILTTAGITPDRTSNSQIVAAIRRLGQMSVVVTDTGTANAYAAANTPALTALPASGYVQRVNIAHANTGASTYAPDGLTAKPIYGLGLQPLQGGELPVGIAILMYLVQAGVNSGNGAWIIIESLGGASQIAPATQSQHALQKGQADSAYLSKTGADTAVGPLTVTNGITVPNNIGFNAKTTGGVTNPLAYIDASNNAAFGSSSLATVIGGSSITLNAAASTTNHAVRAGQVLGPLQTYQNVLGSRSVNVTYTNSTGYPIWAAISASSGSGGTSIGIFIAGLGEVSVSTSSSSGTALAINAVIPTGATYIVQYTGGVPVMVSWNEYR